MYTQQIPILKMVMKVHCEIEFNDTYADNAGVDINKSSILIRLKALMQVQKIDIYSGVDVTFSGE